ncbi:hypothetical protein [Flavobacterium sp.]|uniref:hypothetical protein n=1 Tax=Flavobacterium sp. TaxID=239 RepID=UPI0039E36714
MKKLLLLLLVVFALNGCSTDGDNQPKVYYELVPIDRCQMPYRMSSGETYELDMFFNMPTTCHAYKGIYFEGEGNVKTVAIQATVFERNDCTVIPTSNNGSPSFTTAKYNFTAGAPGTMYTFKIWTGKNEQGENTFYEVEVPVTN